jgi:HK97 family phage major capsid protein/HK97 family phage prohead protease
VEGTLYSVLTIKAIDPAKRLIRGIATTPEPDRANDIVEPLGARFAAEIPLLLHHKKETPVGVARLQPPTSAGIEFEAELPMVADPGPVKDEVDRAWTSVLHKLIRGVSIGFRVLDDAIEPIKNGGFRFLSTEILELSLVTVPAHQGATVAVVKALDQAATGRPTTPPAPGRPTRKAAPIMNIAAQIKDFETSRATKAARMNELMSSANDAGETLSGESQTEYDELSAQVKDINAHLVRMHDLETLAIQNATPVTGASDVTKAAAVRSGVSVVSVKANVPKGTAWTRYAMAVARFNGDKYAAIEYSKQWRDSTPEVEMMLKAAVAPGTTTGATWAAPLVPVQQMQNEFLELLRPRTIIGNLPALRKVPFNVSVPAQTGGGTYGWVGQTKPKPLTALAFATVSLGFAKIAGIVVITEELAKFSSPSAEETVRNDMIAGVAAFMDAQFIDPAVAAVATVNPASITNGAANSASAGTSGDNAKTDIKTLVKTFTTANQSTKNAALIMSESNAFALATALNPLGQPLFGGFTSAGGSIMGIPVVASQAAGTNLIIVDQSGILYADDGQSTIDISKDATLQMDSAPASPADATTVYVSLWQTNCIGLRVERFCTWARARTTAVAYITGAAYV